MLYIYLKTWPPYGNVRRKTFYQKLPVNPWKRRLDVLQPNPGPFPNPFLPFSRNSNMKKEGTGSKDK